MALQILYPALLNQLPAHLKLDLIETFNRESFSVFSALHIQTFQEKLRNLNDSDDGFLTQFREIKSALMFWETLNQSIKDEVNAAQEPKE